MPKVRPSRSASRPALPPAGRAIVDQGFIPVRAKLIDVAAFLDRVERHEVADDFRCGALRAAAELLVDGRPERARRILEILSDPTTNPETKSSGKAALGAWQRPATPAKTGAKPRGKKKK
ncbi:MAG: hypothetical protein ABIZ81_16305 [Opitutaceae bacterium]